MTDQPASVTMQVPGNHADYAASPDYQLRGRNCVAAATTLQVLLLLLLAFGLPSRMHVGCVCMVHQSAAAGHSLGKRQCLAARSVQPPLCQIGKAGSLVAGEALKGRPESRNSSFYKHSIRCN